jgi:TolB protein
MCPKKLVVLVGISMGLMPVSANAGTLAFDRAVIPTTGGDQAYWQIFTVHTDGTQLTRLSKSQYIDEADPTWSPDGTKLAFCRHDGTSWDVWRMTATGTNRHELQVNACDPAWSPNGKKIAFVRGGGLGSAIWVMSASGLNAHAVTTDGTACDDENPAWSPDSSQIAFSQDCASSWHIEAIAVNGSNEHTVGDSQPLNGEDPNWGAAGIVFDGQNGSCINIFSMSASGGTVTNLTMNATYNELEPAWSPTGTQIAYTRRSCAFGENDTITVMNANGTNQTPVVEGDDPVWQP